MDERTEKIIIFKMTLVRAREKNRLSQAGLAKLIGSTKNTVWCWEHGLRYPNITNKGKLEEALGVKFE